MAGLLITEQLLKDLGAENVYQNAWELKLHGPDGGHRFRFVKNDGFWNFKWASRVAPHSYHAVTHLEECFGFIAEDAFEAGRKDAKREVRSVLGITEFL